MKVEQELASIDNKIKSIKAAYRVSGGMVDFKMQKSRTFSVTNAASATFRFTPNYGMGKNNLIDLRPVATIDGNSTFILFRNKPQDGSGNVDIEIVFEIYSPGITYKINIFATGTSEGSFSRIT